MERLLYTAIEKTERTLAEARKLIAKSEELIKQSRAATVELQQQQGQRIEPQSPSTPSGELSLSFPGSSTPGDAPEIPVLR